MVKMGEYKNDNVKQQHEVERLKFINTRIPLLGEFLTVLIDYFPSGWMAVSTENKTTSALV